MKRIRFASWAAVSSQPQAEKESLPDQRRLNREFVDNLGRHYPGHVGEIVAELEVVGSRSIVELSEAMATYPDYARLIELVQSGAINAVVCRSRDRLGRTDSLIVTIERLCLRHDVVVVPRQSLPATLDARELRESEGAGIVAVVEGHFAQAAVRRLVNEHERGIAERVRRRKLFPNHVPWGYLYRYEEDGTRHIVIDPEPAATIRRILVDLFIEEDLSRPEIIQRLNEEGRPTRAGRPWAHDALMEIFRLPDRYAGYILVNTNSKTGREPLRVRGDHEPIITDAELERVKDKLASIRTKRNPPRSVLTGVVICTLSGQPMYPVWMRNSREPTPAFRCGSCEYHPERRPHSIVERRVIEVVRDAVAKLARNADARAVLRKLHAQQVAQAQGLLDNIAGQLAALDGKEQRLLHAYVHLSDAQIDWFDNEMAGIKRQREQLEEQAAQAHANIAAAHSAELSADNLSAIQSLGARMFDHAEPDQLHQWLLGSVRVYVSGAKEGTRALIDKIEFI